MKRPDSSLRWRIADWLYLAWLDVRYRLDYWRDTRDRRSALRRWVAQDWRRFK